MTDIREILRRLQLGEPDRRIARDLGISQNTIRTHIGHLMGKLAVATQVQAVAWAFRAGLADLGPVNRSRPVACPNCGHNLELVALAEVSAEYAG